MKCSSQYCGQPAPCEPAINPELACRLRRMLIRNDLRQVDSELAEAHIELSHRKNTFLRLGQAVQWASHCVPITDDTTAMRGPQAACSDVASAVASPEEEDWRLRARRRVLSGDCFYEEDGHVWLRTSARLDDDLARFAPLAECGQLACACTRSRYPHVRRHFREGVVRRALAARASGASACKRASVQTRLRPAPRACDAAPGAD